MEPATLLQHEEGLSPHSCSAPGERWPLYLQAAGRVATRFISWTIRKGGAGPLATPTLAGAAAGPALCLDNHTSVHPRAQLTLRCVCDKVATAGLTWENPAGGKPTFVEMERQVAHRWQS